MQAGYLRREQLLALTTLSIGPKPTLALFIPLKFKKSKCNSHAVKFTHLNIGFSALTYSQSCATITTI